MGRKVAAAVPLSVGELGPTCRLGRGLPPYQVVEWSIQPFRHNRHGPKSVGLLCPFPWGRTRSPSNTMWPGPRPTSVLSRILVYPALWRQQIWAKKRRVLCPFPWGSWVSSPLATTADMGQKAEGAVPLSVGELGPHLTQCCLGRSLHAYYMWYPDPSSLRATIDMGRKVAAAVPLSVGCRADPLSVPLSWVTI